MFDAEYDITTDDDFAQEILMASMLGLAMGGVLFAGLAWMFLRGWLPRE